MVRVNAILRHPRFIKEIRRVEEIERGRVFCGHGIDHLMDVARIAFILSRESGGAEDKELVYAAALLHDVGRARQYEDDTPHEQESAAIAAEILPECGFDEHETALILDAILAHRTTGGGGKPGFAGLMYKADKASRRCYDCAASRECNWGIKNTALEY